MVLSAAAEEEDGTVNYGKHADSRLISMILFICFPGEPRIIIAFRGNPISQPLILHQSLQYASNPPASACTPASLRRVESTFPQGNRL